MKYEKKIEQTQYCLYITHNLLKSGLRGMRLESLARVPRLPFLFLTLSFLYYTLLSAKSLAIRGYYFRNTRATDKTDSVRRIPGMS